MAGGAGDRGGRVSGPSLLPTMAFRLWCLLREKAEEETVEEWNWAAANEFIDRLLLDLAGEFGDLGVTKEYLEQQAGPELRGQLAEIIERHHREAFSPPLESEPSPTP